MMGLGKKHREDTSTDVQSPGSSGQHMLRYS